MMHTAFDYNELEFLGLVSLETDDTSEIDVWYLRELIMKFEMGYVSALLRQEITSELWRIAAGYE